MIKVIGHSAYEKALPKDIKPLLKLTFFSSRNGGTYIPYTSCHILLPGERISPTVAAEVLTFGFKMWKKQQKVIDKLQAELKAVTSTPE